LRREVKSRRIGAAHNGSQLLQCRIIQLVFFQDGIEAAQLFNVR
jgi:hypothetical protein